MTEINEIISYNKPNDDDDYRKLAINKNELVFFLFFFSAF